MTALPRGPQHSYTNIWWIELPFRRSETEWDITAHCTIAPMLYPSATRQTAVVLQCAIPRVTEGSIHFYFPWEVDGVTPMVTATASLTQGDLVVPYMVYFCSAEFRAMSVLDRDQHKRFADLILKTSDKLGKVQKTREDVMQRLEAQFQLVTADNYQLQCYTQDLEHANYTLRQQFQAQLPIEARAPAELPPRTPARLMHRIPQPPSFPRLYAPSSAPATQLLPLIDLVDTPLPMDTLNMVG
jgi:hypothetical protein